MACRQIYPMKLPIEPFRSPAALARLILPAAIGLGLDLWTKVLAQNGLDVQPEYRFIPGWLHFTYTENRGAVFGIAQGMVPILIVASLAAIIFVLFMFSHSRKQRLLQVLLGMLLAGALGNFYDRIAFGYVRDMIHALPRWPNLFPYIFNVADTLLCISVPALFIYPILFPQDENKPADTSDVPVKK